ncbi:phage tail protein I [Pseudomonas plecoglossicida]|uniref:phage tail protein I n=1 Tax=Pseudomonas TaxID=286 RepID=UPI0002A160EE|nr:MULTISPECIES: phage tail protein I [Pseudomonas]AGA74251.1 phage tail protein I [Pseudomonas putida HB3267]MCE0942024.1 phage tail protein I [Pseudomonas asiatica]MCE0953124.1 phage tail protein I [Pseudomonas asiatica]MCE1062457.1 phage tail protein I [Pseudomonas asiatica]MCE1097778.1 phage tail protein I [Pseudomonas asiatica]
MNLLPGNATDLERQAAEALAQIERVPVPIRSLINPDLCPVALLPLLAWAFSVDRWDSRWPEAAKRASIRSSFFIHSRKGTIGALRRVVEPLGYLIEVIEWWQTEPKGVPGTFAIKVGVSEEGISEETYQELTWLIDDARPVSRHLTGLAISLETSGTLSITGSLYDGDELDIYPPALRDLEVTGSIGRGGREHTIDTLDIAHG